MHTKKQKTETRRKEVIKSYLKNDSKIMVKLVKEKFLFDILRQVLLDP